MQHLHWGVALPLRVPGMRLSFELPVTLRVVLAVPVAIEQHMQWVLQTVAHFLTREVGVVEIGPVIVVAVRGLAAAPELPSFVVEVVQTEVAARKRSDREGTVLELAVPAAVTVVERVVLSATLGAMEQVERVRYSVATDFPSVRKAVRSLRHSGLRIAAVVAFVAVATDSSRFFEIFV
jgi:hypothetical protein